MEIEDSSATTMMTTVVVKKKARILKDNKNVGTCFYSSTA